MGNKVLFLFLIVVVLAAARFDLGVWAADGDEGATIEALDATIETDDKTLDVTKEALDATIEALDATIETDDKALDVTKEALDATIEALDATIETDDEGTALNNKSKTKTKTARLEPRVLASVREFPLFLHKCMATFIGPATLLSTAGCLACIGNCKMYIRVLGTTLENPKDPVYEVQSTVMHPMYEQNPSEYNIGIIYLKGEVPNAPVYNLPNYGIDVTNLPGTVYAWHFADTMTSFRLIKYKAHTISNELCSNYANEFVSNIYVCVVAENILQLGPFDHGTPMLALGEKKGLIMGMFIKPGVVENGEVVEFTSIMPFLEWIKNNTNPNPAPVPPTTTTKKPTTTTKKPTTTTKKPTTTTKKPTTTTKKPTTTTKKPTTTPKTTTTTTTPKPITHPPSTKPYPNPDPDNDQGRGQVSGISFEGHVGGLAE